MNIKRCFAALLALLIIPALILPLTGTAEAARDNEAAVYAGAAYGAVPGSEDAVAVPVGIEGSEYEAHSLDIVLEYDPAMLTAKSVSNGSLWYDLPEDSNKTCDFRSVPGKVFITVLCPTEGFTGSGVLKYIYFTMAEGCTQDQPVTVTVNDFTCYPADGSAVSVPYTTQNGSVNLIDYNQHDLDKLLAFLSIEDQYGFSNGIKADASFEPDYPPTWGDIEWIPYEGELHLNIVRYGHRGFCGVLDLSGCESLVSLVCSGNNITGIDISGCSALEGIDCLNCPVTSIDMSDCPLLSHTVVSTEGGGTIGYYEILGEQTAAAVPDEGYTFVGWYSGGMLVSGNALFDCSACPGALTAVFAEDAPVNVLIGDVNLDGDVTFADVSELYAILTGANVHPNALSVAACDVDGDGDVTFADVSALYDYLIRG